VAGAVLEEVPARAEVVVAVAAPVWMMMLVIFVAGGRCQKRVGAVISLRPSHQRLVIMEWVRELIFGLLDRTELNGPSPKMVLLDSIWACHGLIEAYIDPNEP
jgi:hypothetical protein